MRLSGEASPSLLFLSVSFKSSASPSAPSAPAWDSDLDSDCTPSAPSAPSNMTIVLRTYCTQTVPSSIKTSICTRTCERQCVCSERRNGAAGCAHDSTDSPRPRGRAARRARTPHDVFAVLGWCRSLTDVRSQSFDCTLRLEAFACCRHPSDRMVGAVHEACGTEARMMRIASGKCQAVHAAAG